jgi:hypothetical protein
VKGSITRKKIAFLATTTGVGMLALWFFLRPSVLTPEETVRSILSCYKNSDIPCLMKFQHEFEREQVSITEKQWKEIIVWTKKTLLADTQFDPEIVTVPNGEHQSAGYFTVRKGSRTAKFDLYAEATSTSPKTCLTAIVSKAFYVRTVLDGRASPALDWREYRGANADTLAKYQGDLKRLGFPGFVSNDPEAKLITVEQTIRLYQKMREDKTYLPIVAEEAK